MSEEQSHTYQSTNDVPVEQVNHQSVGNAMDEKLFEDQKLQHPNSNDIEREQAAAQDETAEEKTEETDQFASKFAALSRKEREMRQRESDLMNKISQFEAKMAELESKNQVEDVEEKTPELPLEYRLKKNPLQTLEDMGLSYEKLTELALNDGNLTTDMQLKLMREELENDYKSKFEELNNKLIEKEKSEEEAKYNQTINNFKSEINDFISSNEQYELIQANDAQDLVYDVIEQFYQENDRILDTAEAADQVEQYLEEELKKVLQKSKKLGSWKPEAEKQMAQQTVQRQSPTLSNSLAAQGVNSKADSQLSREESLARLAQQIKWED